ncbi:hypothetical protein J6590_082805 [Homalodisca vitripennis]|nr:hypothetical protein J6590_082805 [Homalodisca vitripennis]
MAREQTPTAHWSAADGWAFLISKSLHRHFRMLLTSQGHDIPDRTVLPQAQTYPGGGSTSPYVNSWHNSECVAKL